MSRSESLRSLAGIARTTRVPSSLAIASMVALPLAMTGSGAFALLGAAPFGLAAMGGFAINDFFDHERDKINKPRRPIPRGLIERRTALIVGILCLASGCLIAAITPQPGLVLAIQLAAIAGVAIYNEVIRLVASAKTLTVGFVGVLPLAYVIVYEEMPGQFLLYPVAGFLLITGRELFMDIQDLPGDVATGLKTLPAIVGSRACHRLGAVLIGISPWLLIPLIDTNLGAITWAVITLILLIPLAIIRWDSPGARVRVIRMLWLPMMMSTVLLVY